MKTALAFENEPPMANRRACRDDQRQQKSGEAACKHASWNPCRWAGRAAACSRHHTWGGDRDCTPEINWHLQETTPLIEKC